MKIWLSKNSEVPVRDQIVTQITLGIISGDLPVGKRLPSTKEISNRFGVHSNTVSNAYRKVAEKGLLEFRKGSGFYVSELNEESLSDDLKLEKLINQLFQEAAKLGFSVPDVNDVLKKRSVFHGSGKMLLVESDAALREILIEEIGAAANIQIEGISVEEFGLKYRSSNVVVAAMIDEKPHLEKISSASKLKIYLTARSVQASMNGEQRPSGNDLIAVISGWEKFLQLSKTMLLAARIEPESLILRSTNEEEWRSGLKAASMIICDSLSAKHFQNDERIRIFQIISDDSLQKIISLQS